MLGEELDEREEMEVQRSREKKNKNKPLQALRHLEGEANPPRESSTSESPSEPRPRS